MPDYSVVTEPLVRDDRLLVMNESEASGWEEITEPRLEHPGSTATVARRARRRASPPLPPATFTAALGVGGRLMTSVISQIWKLQCGD